MRTYRKRRIILNHQVIRMRRSGKGKTERTVNDRYWPGLQIPCPPVTIARTLAEAKSYSINAVGCYFVAKIVFFTLGIKIFLFTLC